MLERVSNAKLTFQIDQAGVFNTAAIVNWMSSVLRIHTPLVKDTTENGKKKENKRLQLRSAQLEGRSYIYVHYVNLASFGVRPVNLRATRKFTGQ